MKFSPSLKHCILHLKCYFKHFFFFFGKRKRIEVGETIYCHLLLKPWLANHEDLNWNSQNPHKTQAWQHASVTPAFLQPDRSKTQENQSPRSSQDKGAPVSKVKGKHQNLRFSSDTHGKACVHTCKEICSHGKTCTHIERHLYHTWKDKYTHIEEHIHTWEEIYTHRKIWT